MSGRTLKTFRITNSVEVAAGRDKPRGPKRRGNECKQTPAPSAPKATNTSQGELSGGPTGPGCRGAPGPRDVKVKGQITVSAILGSSSHRDEDAPTRNSSARSLFFLYHSAS